MAPPFVSFDILQALALFFTLAALIPALASKSVSRMPSWIALHTTCVVYCLSYLILVGHQSGPEPPFALCMFQAGLIYAAPPLVAGAGFVFVVELYLRMSAVMLQRQFNGRLVTWMLRALPVLHSLIFWIDVFSGLKDQSSIERDPSGMYCHVIQDMNQLPTLLTGVFVILSMALMLLLEIYTVVHLFRHRRSTFRNLFTVCGTGSAMVFPLRLFIRTSLYSLIGGLAIVIADVLLNTKTTTFGTLHLLPIIPLSVSLVFVTQMDILRFYMFWRRPRPPVHEDDGIVTVPTPIEIRALPPPPGNVASSRLKKSIDERFLFDKDIEKTGETEASRFSRPSRSVEPTDILSPSETHRPHIILSQPLRPVRAYSSHRSAEGQGPGPF